MRKDYHSDNPMDFRVGDTVQDRQSGEIGIVQRVENAAWSGVNAVVFVYLIKKGYVKKMSADLLSVLRSATDKAKTLVDRSLRYKEPDIPRPSHEVEIARGHPRPQPKSSAADTIRSNVAGASSTSAAKKAARDVIGRNKTIGIPPGVLEWTKVAEGINRNNPSLSRKYAVSVYNTGSKYSPGYTVIVRVLGGDDDGTVVYRRHYPKLEQAIERATREYKALSGIEVPVRGPAQAAVRKEAEEAAERTKRGADALADAIVTRERIKTGVQDPFLISSMKVKAPLEELRDEIHRIYGINTRASSTEGAIGRKILNRIAREMRDEQGGKNIFTIRTRPEGWAGAEEVEEDNALDAVAWLERGIRRQRDRLRELRRAQRVLRSFYADKDFVPEIQQELDWALEEANKIGTNRGQAERYDYMVEALRKAMSMQSSELRRGTRVGHLTSRRAEVRRRAIDLANAIGEEVRRQERGLQEYMGDVNAFSNVANNFGWRSFETMGDIPGGPMNLRMDPQTTLDLRFSTGPDRYPDTYNGATWPFESYGQEWTSEEIRASSASYGPTFRRKMGAAGDYAISGDMTLDEFRAWRRQQWEAIHPEHQSEIVKIGQVISDFKKTHGGAAPSDMDICMTMWGNTDLKSMQRLHNLRRQIPMSPKSRSGGVFTRYTSTLERILEDPANVDDFVIYKPNNVAMRITRVNPLGEGGVRVTLTPQNVLMRDTAGPARLYARMQEGEHPADAFLRILSQAQGAEEVVDTFTSELARVEPEVFNTTELMFGRTRVPVSNVIKQLGLANAKGEITTYQNQIFRSDLGREILSRVGINATATRENQLEDLSIALAGEIWSTLRSSRFRFSSRAIDDQFTKELATAVVQRMGGKAGVLRAMGASEAAIARASGLNVPENVSLSAPIGEEGLTVADTIASADFTESVARRTIFDSPTAMEVGARAAKRGSSDEVRAAISHIAQSGADVTMTDHMSVRRYLIRAGASAEDAAPIAREISRIARGIKRARAEQLFYGELGGYGRIFRGSVEAGRWTEEDIYAALRIPDMTSNLESMTFTADERQFVFNARKAWNQLAKSERAELRGSIPLKIRMRTDLAIKRAGMTTTMQEQMQGIIGTMFPGGTRNDPLIEEVIGNLLVASGEEEVAYARMMGMRLAAQYAANLPGLSARQLGRHSNISMWLLENISNTLGYGNHLPGGVRVTGEGVFWEIGEDLAAAENIVNAFGLGSFRTATIAGRTGAILETAQGQFMMPFERMGLSWESPFSPAKTKGQYGMGAGAPAGVRISAPGGAANPNVLYNVNTGVGYVVEEGYEVEMPFEQMMRSVSFTDEARLSGMRSTNMSGNLPIWQVNDESYIAMSMEGGPQAQFSRLAEVVSGQEEYLALDIETYGPRYSRLGNVGIARKRFGTGDGVGIYDRSFRGWKNRQRLATAKTDIMGAIGDTAAMDAADMQMLTEAAEAINSSPTAKIVIYNENVDLAKLAQMARKHANRLQQNHTKILSNLTNTNQVAELARIEEQMARMNAVADAFNRANRERAINVMFLESAITPEGGYQALSTAAARRGLLKGAQKHTGLADALLTAQVMEAGAGQYLNVNPSNWRQLTLDEFQNQILYGHPTRMRDPYGNDIEVDISNRMLNMTDFKVGINPDTGTEQWSIELTDINTNTKRTLFAEDALQLSSMVQNLRQSGLTNQQAVSEETRIAKDLFNRRIYEVLSGERRGTSPFAFEDIEWKFAYATLPQDQLRLERNALASAVEEGGDPQLRRRLNWIDTELINDARMQRQYSSNLGWFNNQYKVYDKPFFDRLGAEIQAGRVSPQQAEHLIRIRWRGLYGGQEAEGAVFPFLKERAIKPFHEWTITPAITNSYRIRMATPQLTKYGIEDFVIRTFYRTYEGKPQGAMGIMRAAIGEIATEGDMMNFFYEGGKFTRNQVAYREALARHLLARNFRYEGKGVVELIREAAMVPGDVQFDLGMDPTRNLAFGIRDYMKAHMEEQLANNKSLNNQFEGVLWWKGLEDRGYTNREENLARVAAYDNTFWNRIRSQSALDEVVRREEERLYKENPDLLMRDIKFSSRKIPGTFLSGDYSPSVLNMTPRQVVEKYGTRGQTQLAKMLMRDVEEAEFGEAGGFLNDLQRREIEKILGWEDMQFSIHGVTRGRISPVMVGGVERDIGEAVFPYGGRVFSIRSFLAGRTKEEALEMLDKSSSASNMFYEVVHRFYGEDGQRALGAMPEPPAGPSPAERAVSAANTALAANSPKGPSVARSVNEASQAWVRYSGKAEELGSFLSSKMPASADELAGKVSDLVNGRNWIAGGALLLATGIMASKAGIHKDTKPVVDEDSAPEEQIDEPVKDNRVVKTESPQHQRVRARIKGRVASDVDPNIIANAVHAAIDMHTTAASDKTHTISDKRERVTRQDAGRIGKRLLR